jgi:hypothetical protein
MTDASAKNSSPLKSLFFSVLTLKKLCLGQNRQGVSSKLKKTRQLELFGNSDLADFQAPACNKAGRKKPVGGYRNRYVVLF